MLRYAITDRRLFAGDEGARRAALLAQAQRLAAAGVDFLQIREKDLSREGLADLARSLRDALDALPTAGSGTRRMRLLLNVGDLVPPTGDAAWSPETLAALQGETRADGLHLPGGWTVGDAIALRRLGRERPLPPPLEPASPWSTDRVVLSVSCHSAGQCATAARCGADLLLFGPVFEKQLGGDAAPLRGTGLARLREAALAAAPTPVLALGGVTAENAAACMAAGAAGVAGIRLFLAERVPGSTPRFAP